MREIRLYGSEGGGASPLSLPYRHSHAGAWERVIWDIGKLLPQRSKALNNSNIVALPRVRLRRPWALLCNAVGVENSVEPRW